MPVILTTSLWGKYFFWSHFIDEEAEAPRTRDDQSHTDGHWVMGPEFEPRPLGTSQRSFALPYRCLPNHEVQTNPTRKLDPHFWNSLYYSVMKACVPNNQHTMSWLNSGETSLLFPCVSLCWDLRWIWTAVWQPTRRRAKDRQSRKTSPLCTHSQAERQTLYFKSMCFQGNVLSHHKIPGGSHK